MASSTRIPTTNESPNKLIRFRVYPKRYIPINVAIRDAGMETITIKALRMVCRKNSITTATNTTANIKSCITASDACKVNSLLSSTTGNFT